MYQTSNSARASIEQTGRPSWPAGPRVLTDRHAPDTVTLMTTTKNTDDLTRGDVLANWPRAVVDHVGPYSSASHDSPHHPTIPQIDRVIHFTNGTAMSAESATVQRVMS